MTLQHRGKKLSPIQILQIMARARAGERTSDLAEETGVHRAKINRWLYRWGAEADLMERLNAGTLALRALEQIAKAEAG